MSTSVARGRAARFAGVLPACCQEGGRKASTPQATCRHAAKFSWPIFRFAGILSRVLRRKITCWLKAPCWALLAWGLWAACGENASPVSPSLSLEKALVSSSEILEYETLSARLLLWEELLSQAQEQSLRPSQVQPLFPIFTSTGFVAKGFVTKEGPAELGNCSTQSPQLLLKWDERREMWSDVPKEEWKGLSERDVARCLALSLLTQWQIKGEVSLQRVAKSPYAAAYVEGSLRLNPSFVALAAASLELPP